MDERAKMPTCNLTETMFKKWLQQSRNKMTCLHEATVDDLIRAQKPLIGSISFLKVLNFKMLFLKPNRFICNYKSVVPVHCGMHRRGGLVSAAETASRSQTKGHAPPCNNKLGQINN